MTEKQVRSLFMEDPLLLDTLPPPVLQSVEEFTAEVATMPIPNESDESAAARRKKRLIPRSEVARHVTKESLWLIVADMVVDVTEWQREHPGGAQVLQALGGKDATLRFSLIHSKAAKSKLQQFMIGRVKPED